MLTVEPAAFVELRGGLVVPVAALALVLHLEQRGIHVRLCDDHDVLIGPRRLVTDDDRAQVRIWKRHVRAIVAYAADVAEREAREGVTRP